MSDLATAKRWMSTLPRDQFDMLLLLTRDREEAVCKPLQAENERLRKIVTRGCVHAAKGQERTERDDIAHWQTGQREWFDDTILEIVSEYAEWRDSCEPEIERLTKLLGEARDDIQKMRDGYASQMKFCDIDPLPYFREFVRKLDTTLARLSEKEAN